MRYLLILIIILSSCTHKKRIQGYPDIEKIEKSIIIGSDINILLSGVGEPSFYSGDKSIAYYVKISGREGAIYSFVPEFRDVLEINILNGKIISSIRKTGPVDVKAKSKI